MTVRTLLAAEAVARKGAVRTRATAGPQLAASEMDPLQLMESYTNATSKASKWLKDCVGSIRSSVKTLRTPRPRLPFSPPSDLRGRGPQPRAVAWIQWE